MRKLIKSLRSAPSRSPTLDPMPERSLLWTTLIIIAFMIVGTLLLAYFIQYLKNDITETVIAAVGVEIPFVAILFSYWIGVRHSEQLQLLKGISSSINLVDRISRNVDRSMSNVQHEDLYYSCVFPSTYDRRPLPLVAAGDLYALYVMQMLLGQDRIELFDVNDQTIGSRGRNIETIINKNCIFLCSPLANPALRLLAPIVSIANSLPTRAMNVSMAGINLPVWFGSEEIDGRNVGYLYYPENMNYEASDTPPNEMRQARPISRSPSEPSYRVAAATNPNERPEFNEKCQVDYGIIMRLTPPKLAMKDGSVIVEKERSIIADEKPNRKFFVMAGIHQYGTWIAAEYFRRILSGQIKPFGHLLFQENDFAMVVRGDFSTDDLRVMNCDVISECVWQHRESVWQRLGTDEAFPKNIDLAQWEHATPHEREVTAAFRMHALTPQSNR
jgi:hypothetical protein